MGSYLAVGVTGAEAIMTTIHEGVTPCITTWDVRNVTFHAIGLPLCRPVLIEEWDLGPFISAWVEREARAPSAAPDGLLFTREDK
jgi:hypothetical protein